MGRRERPSVKGTDPAYSHTFQTERPKVLPNGMPPSVKIPGLNDDTSKADDTATDDVVAVETAPAPDATDPPARAAEPKVEPAPEAKTEAKRPAAKPSKRAKPKKQSSYLRISVRCQAIDSPSRSSSVAR